MVKEWVKWKTQITQFDKRKTNMGKKKKVNRAQGPMGLYLLLDNKSVIIDMDEKDEV